MKRRPLRQATRPWLRGQTLTWLIAVASTGYLWAAWEAPQDRANARKDMQNGNFAEAYDQLRSLALNPQTPDAQAATDLQEAVQCLAQLGRWSELDDFLDDVVAARPEGWRVQSQAASDLLGAPSQGVIVAGEFERGPHRGGGAMVDSFERDRVRALQWVNECLPRALRDDDKAEVGRFVLQLANQLLGNRGFDEAWRLQYLTDLSKLPDYEEWHGHWRGWGGQSRGAPVDENGQPVFHSLPSSWEQAESDGQRWRWALETAAEINSDLQGQARLQFADFLMQQFGVQTMAMGGPVPMTMSDEGAAAEEPQPSGTYAVETLSDEETIARLATGVKRFQLPEEFNFLRRYREIADQQAANFGEQALDRLVSVYSNRRQYPKAAEILKESILRFGPGPQRQKPDLLAQIIGNWGRFEPTMRQAADGGATFEYRYRNGRKVEFTAHEVLAEKLLDDIKDHLRRDPGQRLDWQRVNLGDIGYRLVQQQENQYIGRQVAQWSLDLDPPDGHRDRRVSVTSPLQRAGAYLLTAAMEGGNTCKIIVWLSDTAIVRKPLSERSLYFVADARDGHPIAGANVEFFGYRQQRLSNGRLQTAVRNFAEKTDALGFVTPQPRDLDAEYQWLTIARGPQNRFAFLGFSGVWAGNYHDQQYNEVKAFLITDRPVYRPKQEVHFKLWIGRAQYDQEGASEFAGQTIDVEIYNPRNEKVLEEKLAADRFGGVEGSYFLTSDVPLGVYRIQTQHGGGSFRVEEYKKPEYEVVVEAPKEPVRLGETVKATIRANYYFGAPVTAAVVKYKITRTVHQQDWYPLAPWDWCYGPGYWWFAYDAPWYPGWSRWVGCMRPAPWWFPSSVGPPELVAEAEAALNADGTLEIEIDTGIAKELFGDRDHRYEITAEVRDLSRRTIVGVGSVIAARQSMRIYTWLERGFYRAGDTVRANFSAQTPDRHPIAGPAQVELFRVNYDQQRQPQETSVQKWDIEFDPQGSAQLQLVAAEGGQYRLACRMKASDGSTIEGGYLFNVIGAGFADRDYRFSAIELIPENREYAPGDKVQLQINSDQPNATVLLFVRAANGVYLKPEVIRLRGKSAVHGVAVTRQDMPNFFVEAVTIFQGRAHHTVKEIVVPPENRVLDVAVLPNLQEYRPGEEARVKIQLKDANGENFVGSTVVAIYDKAVEYISGGSNVPDIREFFWKWRRLHQHSQESTLEAMFGNQTPVGQKGMQDLGIFGGHIVAVDSSSKSGFAAGGEAVMMRGGESLRAAMPAAPGMAAGAAMAMGDASVGGAEGEAAGGPDLVEPTTRSNFADTALWIGSLDTDQLGQAEVSLKMPENLTTWKVKVWGMGDGTRVGAGEASVVTSKNLLVRLQAPRFFVERDEVLLSAVVHNELPDDKQATVILELGASTLELLDEPQSMVMIPAGEQRRVNWRVRVAREGQAIVRMKALTDVESDAVEMTFPCYVHGMLKTESWAGTIRPDQDKSVVRVQVPQERRVEQTRLEIRYSPSLAGAMLDALPYLVDYPYGCTEQTLNRFLPAVLTQRALQKMGLDLDAIEQARTNLNAQEIGDDRQRAEQWKRLDRDPVFDQVELERMVKDGVNRLINMQSSDGGWGWFSGAGETSWPHTTAVVVRGLLVAQQNDVALPPDVLPRGLDWLQSYQQGEWEALLRMAEGQADDKGRKKARPDDLDALVCMILCEADRDHALMRERLYQDRNDLSVYGKALLGLTLHKMGRTDELSMVMRNLSQYLVEDDENETAYLNLPNQGYWWFWHGDEIEANASYLRILSRTDPKGAVAPRLVKYLLNNRKHATYWKSTRDTALCVEAFGEYLNATNELRPDMTVSIYIDGQKHHQERITAENLFSFNNKMLVLGQELSEGEHEIEIRREGQGPVYFNVYLTNFTLEEFITAAGLEIQVDRKIYRLQPVEASVKVAGQRGQALDQQVEKYERIELKDGESVNSGDLIEVELELESKNDYEYVMFEDFKAAGFEPMRLQSGYAEGGLGAYMELRDERVTFFMRQLARGRNSVSYRLRAEIPGKFAALPAKCSAMYAPELKGNSDEIRLKILEERLPD